MTRHTRIWKKHFGLLASLVCTLYLAGCASNPPARVEDLSPGANDSTAGQVHKSASPAAAAGGSYRVVRGDTLYAIAFKHGLDFRDLASWNRIPAPYRIYAGQELSLMAPSSAAPKPGVALTSPAPDRAAATASPLPTPARNPNVDNAAPPQKPPVAAATRPPDASVPPVVEVELKGAPAAPVAQTAATAKPAPASFAAADASANKAAEGAPQLNAGGVSWRWPGNGKVVGTYVSGDQTRQGIDIAGKEGDSVQAAADGEVVYSGNGLLGYGELIIVKHNASFLSAYGHNRKRLVQEGDKVKAGQQIAEMGSSASSREELHFEIRKNGKPVNPLDYLPVR
jgi:lipoprotein NlpD